MGGDKVPTPFDDQVELFDLWKKRTFGITKSTDEIKIHTPEQVEIPREEIKVERYKCKRGEHIYLGIDGRVSIVKMKYPEVI